MREIVIGVKVRVQRAAAARAATVSRDEQRGTFARGESPPRIHGGHR
jgi:hypothetical protein